MSTKYVIARESIPSYPPIHLTIIVWLLLDRFDPAGWVCGVVWTIVALLWIGFLVNFSKEKEVVVTGSRTL